nr:hypothetical protein [Chitinophaga pinensis]
MLNIQNQTLSATRSTYGEAGGEPLEQIILENAAIRVELINLGATITAIYAPDRDGLRKNIVAGFSHPDAYWQNLAYFGATVGRYANRIAVEN